MTLPLPGLTGLRAFEAAARHLSFTRAAEELHVTQTAVSHQIRKLEDQLGVKLFLRRIRAVELTREAEAYLPAVRAASHCGAACVPCAEPRRRRERRRLRCHR